MEKQMQILAKKFPDVWFKDGGEFNSGHRDMIWTGEGSYIGEWSAFNKYAYDSTFGVHPKLAHALKAMGLVAEFFDAGTVFIYKD